MDRGRSALALFALVFSGAIQALIAAPYSWVALHPVALVPALWVIARQSGRRAFLAGWLFGASANAAIFVWLVHTVTTFTALGAWLGISILVLFAAAHGLYAAVFAWGFARVRRAAGAGWPLAIAIWFTACEFLAPHFFPYRQGVAWYVEPGIALAAATTGISGLTLLVLYANALVLQTLEVFLFRQRRRPLVWNAIVFSILVLGALGLAARQQARITAAEAAATPIRLALVQPGEDRPSHDRGEAEQRAENLAALAGRALAADPSIQVVVLPEKAIEFEPSRAWNRSLRELAERFDVEVWTGGAASDRSDPERPRVYNAAFRIRPDGAASPRYDKNVLVPFGESMPLGAALDGLAEAIGRPSFAAGEGMPLYDAFGARFAFLICYEAILPAYIREPVRRGADLIVNLTYDGWFGDGGEPAQHLMLVAAQAAQLGVPIVRSTSTGISALIDARGRVTARIDLHERRVLVGDVAALRAAGLYVAWGDWLAWGCVLGSALPLVRGQRPTSRRTSTAPSENSTAAGSI